MPFQSKLEAKSKVFNHVLNDRNDNIKTYILKQQQIAHHQQHTHWY